MVQLYVSHGLKRQKQLLFEDVPMAQWIEQRTSNSLIEGSNPSRHAKLLWNVEKVGGRKEYDILNGSSVTDYVFLRILVRMLGMNVTQLNLIG